MSSTNVPLPSSVITVKRYGLFASVDRQDRIHSLGKRHHKIKVHYCCATHTHSRSNLYSAIEVLKVRSKLLRKAVYQIEEDCKKTLPQKNETNDFNQEINYCRTLQKTLEKNQPICEIPAVKEKLNLLKETIDDTQEYFLVSTDEEARLGHKTVDSSFFGYKTHLAMTEKRIITAAVVASREKGDGPETTWIIGDQSAK